MADRDDALTWVKSLHSSGGACVEVAQRTDAVLIRNSRHPAGPWLSVRREVFAELVSAVRAGEFDRAE